MILAFERLTQDYCYELEASLGLSDGCQTILYYNVLDPHLKNPNQGQERYLSD